MTHSPAARAGPDILLLDNMTTDSVRYTLHELEQAGIRDKVTIELSGGITRRDHPGKYARTGGDVISLGILTHSVRTFSVTLDIQK